MRKEVLQQEVALTLGLMKDAPAQEFGYLVGKLSALLWVQHDGEMLRIDAHEAACRAWREMRKALSTTVEP